MMHLIHRALRLLVVLTILLNFLNILPVNGQPLLYAFVGQRNTYHWEVESDFSEYLYRPAVIRIEADALYLIQAFSSIGLHVFVQIVGNIFWPDGSINHELEFGFYEGNETVFSTFTTSNNVDSFHVNFTEIIRDNGYVAAITGTCQVIASFTFPGNYSRYRSTFYQDYLAERSAYFTDELTGESGEFVNAWRRWVLVQGYDLIQTNVGNRPAINLGDNLTNWIFEPSRTWIRRDYYSHWYDLETGFLLLSDYRMSMTSENITITKFYRGVLVSTNMYVPRIEQIFPWIGIVVLLVGVLVIGILSLWLGKRLRSPHPEIGHRVHELDSE